MSSRFKLLTGDVSGIPATYCRSSNYGRCFDVYEVNEWADLDSSAIATHGKYNVQAGVVSLEHADTNVNALKCCGLRIVGNEIVTDSGDVVATSEDAQRWDAVLVECLWLYGAKDVFADVSGNNLRAAIRAARGAL
jgi:hypothetical protein